MLRPGLAIVAAVLCLPVPAASQPLDRAAWISDLEQVKEAITRESPNLEWAAQRGLDLPAVERRARERLAAATGDAAARSALERFVASFADGHMELGWPEPPARVAGVPARRSTCAELGYWSEPDDYAVAPRLAGYTPVGPQGGQVRAGMVQVAGRSVGVLRIPLFAPSDGTCAAVLARRKMRADSRCEDACADAVSRKADELFLSAIARALRALERAKAELLVLDVANNGGGNDSAIAVARMIGGADVPTPALAVVRTAERAKDLEEDEAIVKAAPGRATPARRALTRRLLAFYSDARAQAARPCDLSPLWRGEPAGCTNLIRGFYAGGLVSFDLPADMRQGEWAETVSWTARFDYKPGVWTRPVMVLVDGASASSTELLAAMLQDAGRATIIGSPTFGAGCGWTMPRREVVLRHSGGRLVIPDCARFRRDGRNEIDGVEPDILVGFRRSDTPRQRAERLAMRLPAAVEAVLRSAAPPRP